MYKVAIVSSENEMLRFEWADVRHMLRGDAFKDYIFDMYIADNINDLFYKLRQKVYDSVVFTTNSCNEKPVYNALIANKNVIEEFIKMGHGIFISLQIHVAAENGNMDFLPDEFSYRSVKRNASEGELSKFNFHNHDILEYIEDVSCDEISERCINNQFVSSHYIAYIEPNEPAKYDVVIEDKDYEDRPVLLCSQGNNNKIVISTMVIDWQEHKDLFVNIVKYVTEGVQTVALIGKNCSHSIYFDYLKEVMGYSKIAYKEYRICSGKKYCQYCDEDYSFAPRLDNDRYNYEKPDGCGNIQEIVKTLDRKLFKHTLYITDPDWNEKEINVLWEKLKTNSKVVHLLFFADIAGVKNVTDFTNRSDIVQMESDVCAWIHRGFDDQKGRWQNSFWATCDVIEMFDTLNQDVSLYVDSIINGLRKNLRNNSYDSVVSPTCALLKLFFKFKGKEDEQYKKTLNWINTKIENASSFEKLTICNTFFELGENMPETIINEIEQYLESIYNQGNDDDSDMNILRNCQFYLYKKDIEHLRGWLSKLLLLQGEDGSWVNCSRTGKIIRFLIRHRDWFSATGLMRLPDIKDMDSRIFHGVSYLISTYNNDECNWNSDIPSTAAAISALAEFENIIEYPIDKIVNQISYGQKSAQVEETKNSLLKSLLELRTILTKQIKSLTEEKQTVSELKKQNRELTELSQTQEQDRNNILETLKKLNKASRKKTRICIWTALTAFILVAFFVWFIISLYTKNIQSSSNLLLDLGIFFIKDAWPFIFAILGYPLSAFVQISMEKLMGEKKE